MQIRLDLETGRLTGPLVQTSSRTLEGLAGYFLDDAARQRMDLDQVIYSVESYEPEPEGVDGAVCCAVTTLHPGRVGDECFMTRGHFHSGQDCPEMEMTVSGQGLFVFMDRTGNVWTEEMSRGSVHHVPVGVAHRAANTGETPLVFVSFWPSQTGHDYEIVRDRGFGARVRIVDGTPALLHDTRP